MHSLIYSDGEERRGNATAWDWKRTTWVCCGVVTCLANQSLPTVPWGTVGRDWFAS